MEKTIRNTAKNARKADEMPEREGEPGEEARRGKTLDRSAFAAEIYGKHFMNLCQRICANVRREFALRIWPRKR